MTTSTHDNQGLAPEAGRMAPTGDELAQAIEILLATPDSVLSDAVLVLLEEQRNRARDRGDLDVLVDAAFSRGIDAQGRARDPWIEHGMVFCPGSLIERSATSHECTFGHVGEDWIWESPELVTDEVRQSPGAGRHRQHSISVLGAVEGLELDVISSTKRQGLHKMTSVRSYRVRGGELELTSTRSPKVTGHR